MDPTIAAAFANLTLMGSQRTQMQSFTDHAVLERMLIQGGDPANYADLQTGSHVPTPQPYTVPGFVYNPSSQPAGVKAPGT